MAVILGIIYPTCVMSFASIFSFIFYAITRRLVIIPLALLSTGITFPFVTIAAVQIGRYIRDYSHLYRGKRDIREWLDFKKRNPYFFTEENSDKRDEPPIFNRQRTQESRYIVFLQILILFNHSRKSTHSFDIGPDLYGLLGVSRVANDSDIKRAYLLKAKEFHPDRNIGNKQIEEKFKLINQAYAILSDREQRQIFDEYGYDHVKYK